jgi:hypothetical protein
MKLVNRATIAYKEIAIFLVMRNINLDYLVPADWAYEELDDGKAMINYTASRGNYNRKNFILPGDIPVDKRFVEAIALYLGDGDYNKINKAHLSFVSKDKELVAFFLNFLRHYFNLNNRDLTVVVRYRRRNPHIKKEWGRVLRFHSQKIITKSSKRHKEEACTIQVNGVVFRKVFELVINKFLGKGEFLRDKCLRRAFLRGLFAAEGNVGIDYKERYISQISFSISTKEIVLRDFIIKALNYEHIRHRINIYEDSHSLVISISNWGCYLRLWKISLFDLCRRKKGQFLTIARNLDIYFCLKPSFRKKFFSDIPMMQKHIAKLIGSWQANVSRTITGNHLLRVEQIVTLLDYSACTKKEVIDNLVYARVGSLTKLNVTKDLLRFLKELKSF